MARSETATSRRILMVSLPYGPFGGALTAAFRAAGADVRHMVFNAGDLISHRGPGAIVWRESLDVFAAALPDLARGFTDIVVFGQGSPQNQAVLRLAPQPGTTVWVLENGYFRPHWITLERGGANADSQLPRTAEGYAAHWPMPGAPVPVGPSVRALAFHISLYYLAELLGRAWFIRHRPAFAVAPWRQALAHARRYLRRGKSAAPPEHGTYFLACLQRDGDSQLLLHSDLRDNAAFLDATMTSFAATAPSDVGLVVKNHPLDSGQVDLAVLTRRLADRNGLLGRVHFIDGGNLARLCRGSRGLVVNNSGSGFAALGFGTPVKALGRALYDITGLTDQQPLDSFWVDPVAPDPDLFERFRSQVMARTQIDGSFDAPGMRRITAQKVAAAILAYCDG